MKLIVGLGNPEEKYQYTRHNVGFMVVDKFVKRKLSLVASLRAWSRKDKFKSYLCNLKDMIIIKPQTYMNNSGWAVSMVAKYYKIETGDIWVVHDDIDLPLGKIRIRKGGASAGHRGIDSIIKELKDSNFVRFRLGIGKGKLEAVKTTDINLHRQLVQRFVLSLFKDTEGGESKNLVKRGVEALEYTAANGIEKAMNRFN